MGVPFGPWENVGKFALRTPRAEDIEPGERLFRQIYKLGGPKSLCRAEAFRWVCLLLRGTWFFLAGSRKAFDLGRSTSIQDMHRRFSSMFPNFPGRAILGLPCVLRFGKALLVPGFRKLLYGCCLTCPGYSALGVRLAVRDLKELRDRCWSRFRLSEIWGSANKC